MTREVTLTATVVLALVLIGTLMVYSARTVLTYGPDGDDEAKRLDRLAVLRQRLMYAVLGVAAMVLAARFDYHTLRKRWLLWPLMGTTAALLLVVLALNVRQMGAVRWIRVGSFSFQPSELAKAAIVIWLAVKLAENHEQTGSFRRGFAPILGTVFLFAGLIAAERDIGTPVVLVAATLLVLAMAGARWWHLAISVAPGAAMVGLYVWLFPHAQARIVNWRDPWQDPLEGGYQLIQSLQAFARGGLTGQGLGAGHQKLRYLSQADSDFVFAVWGEEMGLIGTVVLVALFMVFMVVAFRIAVCAPDLFGSLLAAGITTLISLQAVFNMAVATGLVPTKGLPLPFVSAGGTALIMNLVLTGILLNVGFQAVERDEPALKPASQP